MKLYLPFIEVKLSKHVLGSIFEPDEAELNGPTYLLVQRPDPIVDAGSEEIGSVSVFSDQLSTYMALLGHISVMLGHPVAQELQGKVHVVSERSSDKGIIVDLEEILSSTIGMIKSHDSATAFGPSGQLSVLNIGYVSVEISDKESESGEIDKNKFLNNIDAAQVSGSFGFTNIADENTAARDKLEKSVFVFTALMIKNGSIDLVAEDNEGTKITYIMEGDKNEERMETEK